MCDSIGLAGNDPKRDRIPCCVDSSNGTRESAIPVGLINEAIKDCWELLQRKEFFSPWCVKAIDDGLGMSLTLVKDVGIIRERGVHVWGRRLNVADRRPHWMAHPACVPESRTVPILNVMCGEILRQVSDWECDQIKTDVRIRVLGVREVKRFRVFETSMIIHLHVNDDDLGAISDLRDPQNLTGWDDGERVKETPWERKKATTAQARAT